jgi:hypothetical protein
MWWKQRKSSAWCFQLLHRNNEHRSTATSSKPHLSLILLKLDRNVYGTMIQRCGVSNMPGSMQPAKPTDIYICTNATKGHTNTEMLHDSNTATTRVNRVSKAIKWYVDNVTSPLQRLNISWGHINRIIINLTEQLTLWICGSVDHNPS